MLRISVQHEPFDVAAEQEALYRGQPQVGALVTFVGLTRQISDERTIQKLQLEHYPGMTERALTEIAEAALARWPLDGVTVIHRVGTLEPQDPIVFVGVTSGHREAAFRACEFLIDYLKTKAPFWKKETGPAGEHWVGARESDDLAARRWDEAPSD